MTTVFNRKKAGTQRRKPIISLRKAVRIIDLYHNGRTRTGKYYSMPKIAKMYGVSTSTIYDVVRRRGAYKEV